jgi:hypothetical protein
LPECHLTIDQWTMDQDVVVARWSLCGTEVGEYLGLPLVVRAAARQREGYLSPTWWPDLGALGGTGHAAPGKTAAGDCPTG